MAWTQSEVDQVRAAVVALATGSRKASVSYSGPPSRPVSYVPAQLGELRALLSEMERQVSGTPSFRRAAFSKGFDNA